MVNVDLLDAQHRAQMLQPLSNVTHIFYSAWVNAANWSDMVEPNVTMLRNLVSHIEQTSPLQTVSLMQGYKVYTRHTSSRLFVGCITRPIPGPRPGGPPQAAFKSAPGRFVVHPSH